MSRLTFIAKGKISDILAALEKSMKDLKTQEEEGKEWNMVKHQQLDKRN